MDGAIKPGNLPQKLVTLNSFILECIIKVYYYVKINGLIIKYREFFG